MSTPEQHEPDRKSVPAEEHSEQGNNPEKLNESGEKKVEKLGDGEDNKLNLASKSGNKQGWKNRG